MPMTPGPWSAALSDNSIVALHDGEGKHFANFRNVRGESPWADAKAIALLPEARDALRALLDWGREHTSPLDENSPHNLLVRAAAVLAEMES